LGLAIGAHVGQLFVLIYLSIMLPYRTGLSVPAFSYFFVLETAMDSFFLVDIVRIS
jgi:hypothetical protein